MKAREIVPPRFAEARLDNVLPVFAAMKLYAEMMTVNLQRGLGLLVTGPVGVGKTWATAALTIEYRRKFHGRGCASEFVTSPAFFDHMNEFSDDRWDDYRDQEWSDTYTRVPWLVINDLGKEYRGGKVADQVVYRLGRVLRERCEHKRVTHITTNLDNKGLRETYGEAVMSLLSEMTRPLIINGPDLRKEKKT